MTKPILIKNIRPFVEPSSVSEFEGDSESKTGNSTLVHEDLSTKVAHKLPTEVELCKKYIVVIGSGVMGSGIAAQIANAGLKVHLLDIIPIDADDRNIIAKQAIIKLQNTMPPPLAKQELAANIILGNLEDDLEVLKSADWIIEVIIEKLELKQILYKKLEQYCQPNCIISSNTSTIPLAKLIENRNNNFKQHFLISHFFNPPRFMPLLELITSKFTKIEVIKAVSDFLDIDLGKTIVKSNDSPGFIANRIGCYWLEAALTTAIEMGITVEQADSLLGKPIGIPKTAIFGLYDLIGIDLMKLIAKSLSNSLTADDDFLKVSKPHPLINKMIEDGYTGRKSKGGFYRIIKGADSSKTKESINLKTGEYSLSEEIICPITNIRELIDNNTYALKVLSRTLSYAAGLIPEATNNLSDIDQVMKQGYNWKFGPFELIDQIGPSYFKQKLEQQNIKVPDILDKLEDQSFYQNNCYFNNDGNYTPIIRPEGIILLESFKIVEKNNSAKILDIGNNIAAIEFTSKMAVANLDVFNLIIQFFSDYSYSNKGIVIANNQANFSVGGDLSFMLEMAENKNWQAIDNYLKLGQTVMMKIKNSPIPVVCGAKGMALGGGCELLLHSTAVVAHLETNAGLVETGVGLIPSWGGCKEMILRSNSVENLINAFKNILAGNISSSSYQMQDMLKLENFKLCMNLNRVISDSKELCRITKTSWFPKEDLAFKNIKVDWQPIIDSLNLSGHDLTIAKELSSIFSQANPSENSLLEQEREIFIRLIQTAQTQERIRYMLKTGKRIKN